MSKKNGRGPTEINVVDASQTEVLSSGVQVTVLPFPARLYDSIQTKGNEKYPEPVPPKKIIKVVDGTEEVDDLKNPQYLEEKEQSKALRETWIAQRIGETVLDFCLLVDVSAYGHIIKKLEKTYEEPAPVDSDERRLYFLTNYALRGRADYERVSSLSITLMAVGDKEIVARMDSFRSEMARTTDNSSETPSPVEV
jgi:hypothetical protein